MKLKLAAIFSSNMILQHGKKIPIWGWSEPGDKITVKFAKQTRKTVANKQGRWMLKLNHLEISIKPATMTVSSKNSGKELSLKNVLVGDVWVCSGQSNMEWPVCNTMNSGAETAAANYPNIRLFSVPHVAQLKPAQDIKGKWNCCSPESIGKFSAIGYFFAREIHRKTGIPVGLINTSWGGTRAEAWTNRKTLTADPFFKKMLKEYEKGLISPDKIQQKMQEEQKKWAEKHDFKDTTNAGAAKGWQKPDTDTADWPEMDLPGNWQGAGHDYSGIFWFRLTVDIPKEWKEKDLTLSLGALDKSDVSYFNGVQVGSITIEESPDAWCTPRIYKVPGKLVKPGKNLIAVRVYSNIFQGGFIGTPAQMKLFPAADKKAEAIPLAGAWKYQIEANFGLVPAPPAPPLGEGNPNSPHILFDNMINPLLPLGIKGAIWYQGESNADKALQYRKLFPLMINNWRKAWKQGNFPFYFVQLANYQAPCEQPVESYWAELREAQTMTLALPRTGMAVTIDIGEANDIHPKNKQDVGLRLALPALADNYGFKNIVFSGPIYKTMKIVKSKIHLSFYHVGGGLVVHGKKLEGFAIAGKDRKFVWAKAEVIGDSVLVSHPKIRKPVAVRYAWAENPVCNLFNSSDLPASPFRTDNWPGISEGLKNKGKK